MSELIAALVIWIASESGLAPAPPPRIVMLPREQMSVIAYNRAWQDGDDIRGAYDSRSRTVYLSDVWRIDDLRSQATLLHELVHHMQAFNDVLQGDCHGPREAQAYALTLRYLRDEGIANPYAMLEIDEFTVMAVTQCLD